MWLSEGQKTAGCPSQHVASVTLVSLFALATKKLGTSLFLDLYFLFVSIFLFTFSLKTLLMENFTHKSRCNILTCTYHPSSIIINILPILFHLPLPLFPPSEVS